MGRLKNLLLKQLETDTLFADHYWQTQDQQPEPELPNGYDWPINQSALTLIVIQKSSVRPAHAYA